ncbi:MAG: hypothetical protein I8H75_04880 [Myxococcaceae bacterium]|nr:hypothetical protein [Myxococcaceae bacterium]MBH2006659.1 hypothetical protein [Myxococcaceae bacterium]
MNLLSRSVISSIFFIGNAGALLAERHFWCDTFQLIDSSGHVQQAALTELKNLSEYRNRPIVILTNRGKPGNAKSTMFNSIMDCYPAFEARNQDEATTVGLWINRKPIDCVDLAQAHGIDPDQCGCTKADCPDIYFMDTEGAGDLTATGCNFFAAAQSLSSLVLYPAREKLGIDDFFTMMRSLTNVTRNAPVKPYLHVNYFDGCCKRSLGFCNGNREVCSLTSNDNPLRSEQLKKNKTLHDIFQVKQFVFPYALRNWGILPPDANFTEHAEPKFKDFFTAYLKDDLLPILSQSNGLCTLSSLVSLLEILQESDSNACGDLLGCEEALKSERFQYELENIKSNLRKIRYSFESDQNALEEKLKEIVFSVLGDVCNVQASTTKSEKKLMQYAKNHISQLARDLSDTAPARLNKKQGPFLISEGEQSNLVALTSRFRDLKVDEKEWLFPVTLDFNNDLLSLHGQYEHLNDSKYCFDNITKIEINVHTIKIDNWICEGKNINIKSVRLEKGPGVSILNVSAPETQADLSILAPAKLGTNGIDGFDGKPGGNVSVLVWSLVGDGELQLISYGGHGTRGQDGGSGKPGAHGKPGASPGCPNCGYCNNGSPGGDGENGDAGASGGRGGNGGAGGAIEVLLPGQEFSFVIHALNQGGFFAMGGAGGDGGNGGDEGLGGVGCCTKERCGFHRWEWECRCKEKGKPVAQSGSKGKKGETGPAGQDGVTGQAGSSIVLENPATEKLAAMCPSTDVLLEAIQNTRLALMLDFIAFDPQKNQTENSEKWITALQEIEQISDKCCQIRPSSLYCDLNQYASASLAPLFLGSGVSYFQRLTDLPISSLSPQILAEAFRETQSSLQEWHKQILDWDTKSTRGEAKRLGSIQKQLQKERLHQKTSISSLVNSHRDIWERNEKNHKILPKLQSTFESSFQQFSNEVQTIQEERSRQKRPSFWSKAVRFISHATSLLDVGGLFQKLALNELPKLFDQKKLNQFVDELNPKSLLNSLKNQNFSTLASNIRKAKNRITAHQERGKDLLNKVRDGWRNISSVLDSETNLPTSVAWQPEFSVSVTDLADKIGEILNQSGVSHSSLLSADSVRKAARELLDTVKALCEDEVQLVSILGTVLKMMNDAAGLDAQIISIDAQLKDSSALANRVAYNKQLVQRAAHFGAERALFTLYRYKRSLEYIYLTNFDIIPYLGLQTNLFDSVSNAINKIASDIENDKLARKDDWGREKVHANKIHPLSKIQIQTLANNQPIKLEIDEHDVEPGHLNVGVTAIQITIKIKREMNEQLMQAIVYDVRHDGKCRFLGKEQAIHEFTRVPMEWNGRAAKLVDLNGPIPSDLLVDPSLGANKDYIPYSYLGDWSLLVRFNQSDYFNAMTSEQISELVEMWVSFTLSMH